MSGPPQSGRAWFWGPYSGLALAVALATFAADQAHKWWMVLGYGLREKGRVEVLPFMDVVYVINTGISYSLFDSSSQAWQYLLAVFAAIVALAMWVWIARGAQSRLFAASLALIIGGALGNALDRILVGGVIDYVSLHAYGFYWYVFNIADVAIVVGVIGLLYESMIASRNSAAKAP